MLLYTCQSKLAKGPISLFRLFSATQALIMLANGNLIGALLTVEKISSESVWMGDDGEKHQQ